MANQLGFYYRPKLSTGKFYNITENVLHNTLSWSDSTANELLEFTFDINTEFLDEDDNYLTVVPGDEIIVTEDENRSFVFRNLTGIVINPGQESTGSWDNSLNRGDNRYSVVVRQKDFSKTNVILDYKEPISLNNLLNVILQDTDNNLGGIDSTGSPLAKVILSCPNEDIASADFKGTQIEALNSILTPLGYKYRLRYSIVKDDTLLIKRIVTQLEIFQRATPPVTSTYALGISNTDINYGVVNNPSFDPYDLENKPFFLLGESSFKVDYDFDSIINQITLIGLVQDGTSLKRWTKDLTGDRKADYNLGYKYKDILFVARLISSIVTIDSVPTFSPNITFSIDEFSAEKIENYDQLKADFLVCRIVHNNIEYFYKFTISGGLVTLGELAYGSTPLPEALSYEDVFELVKSVTIYEDNRQFLEGYGQYGVIKNVSLENSEATLKFLEDDIPRAFDTIISYGYKLESYLETHNFMTSQRAYGIRPVTETIDFPLTLDQLQNILSVASENSEPAIQISFTTLRPEEIQAGWEFPVIVEGRVNGIYVVTSINCKYICASGEQGKHLVETQVVMGIKRASLQDTLSSYRRSYELSKTVMSRGNEKDIFREELFFDFSFSGSVRLPAPTGLTVDSVGDTTATLSWDEVPSAKVYHLYLSADGGLTWLPGYGSGGLYDIFVSDLIGDPVANLVDLPEFTELTAFVTAEDLYGESALSGSVAFETGVLPIPDTPTGLTIDSYTNTTAEISFNSVSGATSYKLYIYDAGVPISGYNGKVISATSEAVTGLSENTTYTVYVSACNSAGCSALSSGVTFKTKEHRFLLLSNEVTRNYYYLVKANGTGKTKLTTNNTYPEGELLGGDGKISPNGRYVAYSRPTASSTYGLFIYDIQANTENQVSTVGSTVYFGCSWNSLDPDHIYCIKGYAAATSYIVKININTLAETALRTFVGSGMYFLTISNDGLRALFREDSSSGGGTFTIKSVSTANWAGSSSTIYPGILSNRPFQPRFNYNDTKILIPILNGSYFQIYDCNIDGTGLTQRTTGSNSKTRVVQQKVSPFDITYNYQNGGDLETWVMAENYTGNTLFVDTVGNNDVIADWGLVQF